jgi:hypothetical protein
MILTHATSPDPSTVRFPRDHPPSRHYGLLLGCLLWRVSVASYTGCSRHECAWSGDYVVQWKERYMCDTPDDDAPLYDLDHLPPELLQVIANRHLYIMHYGERAAVCGAEVPVRQRTDITALVSCETCLGLVPPPSRGHWAVVYGPKMTEEF